MELNLMTRKKRLGKKRFFLVNEAVQALKHKVQELQALKQTSRHNLITNDHQNEQLSSNLLK